jgi:selenocysteine-specific elongation factor
VLVNPQPERRWKRFQPDILHALATRMEGTPAERVAQAARAPEKRAVLQQQLGYNKADFETAVREALVQNLLVELPSGELLSRSGWEQITHRMEAEIRAFHQAEPLRLGMSREELRSRLGLKSTTFTALLDMQDQITAENDRLRLHDHQIRFSESQQQQIAAFETRMAAEPYTPPSFAQAVQLVGENVLRALIELGHVVQVQDDVIFSRAAYDEMVSAVLQIIDAEDSVSASGLRDRFNTTRKYAIGLLEHLDSAGITRRVGDARVRGHRSR